MCLVSYCCHLLFIKYAIVIGSNFSPMETPTFCQKSQKQYISYVWYNAIATGRQTHTRVQYYEQYSIWCWKWKAFSSRIQNFSGGILKSINARKNNLFCGSSDWGPVLSALPQPLHISGYAVGKCAEVLGKHSSHQKIPHIDRKHFTTLFASRIIDDTIKPLTCENRSNTHSYPEAWSHWASPWFPESMRPRPRHGLLHRQDIQTVDLWKGDFP